MCNHDTLCYMDLPTLDLTIVLEVFKYFDDNIFGKSDLDKDHRFTSIRYSNYFLNLCSHFNWYLYVFFFLFFHGISLLVLF